MINRLAVAGLLATFAIVAGGLGNMRAGRSHAGDAGAYGFEPPVIGLRLPDAELAGIRGAPGTPAGLAPARSIPVVQAADDTRGDRHPSQSTLGQAPTAHAVSENLNFFKAAMSR